MRSTLSLTPLLLALVAHLSPTLSYPQGSHSHETGASSLSHSESTPPPPPIEVEIQPSHSHSEGGEMGISHSLDEPEEMLLPNSHAEAEAESPDEPMSMSHSHGLDEPMAASHTHAEGTPEHDDDDEPMPEWIRGDGSPTPEGCTALPGDESWPAHEIWEGELPGAEELGWVGGMKRPDWMLMAETVEDVQRAVNFVRNHNMRLAIINSGHDFLGRNDAPSGLLLNVNGLKGVRILEEFVPTMEGAEPVNSGLKTNTLRPVEGKQMAATIGGGMAISELNGELFRSGLWAEGAAHDEVSVAGGWSQNGGHAAFSAYYGLGVDQILEYKVVTADGNVVIANAVSNPDLFWAMRGGGSATWGVVVEATVKIYPQPKVVSYYWYMNTTDFNDHKSIFPAATYMIRQLPTLQREAGISGYFYVHNNALRGSFFCLNEYADAKKMKSYWDPVLEKMVSFPGVDPDSLIRYQPEDIRNATNGLSATWGKPATTASEEVTAAKYKRHYGPEGEAMVGAGIWDMDSRLLTEEAMMSDYLQEALEKAVPDLPWGQLESHLNIGPKVHAMGADTAVLPAWRKAWIHMIATGTGSPNASSLRTLEPDSGAYINEAWILNPDWKQTFWGSNYAKLVEVKKKWDPSHLFYVTPGIGADLMVYRHGRMCKVEGPLVEADVHASAPLGDNRNIQDVTGNRQITFPMLYAGEGKPPVPRPMPKMTLPAWMTESVPKDSNSSETTGPVK